MKNESVDISFVIPAYNEELLIGQCIGSVLRECKAHPELNIEVIVVNNNSSDDTASVVESFSGVTLVNEGQQGLVWARKAGLEASNGRLIANLDADTMVPRGWLNIVKEEFVQHPDLVALTGPHSHYDLPFRHRFIVGAFYLVFAYSTYIVNRFVLRKGSMVQGGNFVVTKKALEQIGYNPEVYSFYGEDGDLAKRLHALGPVKFRMSFYIYASGRRLIEEGMLHTGIKYIANYLSVMLRKKPLSTTHSDIRINTKRTGKFSKD